jgi:hypothetical protein
MNAILPLLTLPPSAPAHACSVTDRVAQAATSLPICSDGPVFRGPAAERANSRQKE